MMFTDEDQIPETPVIMGGGGSVPQATRDRNNNPAQQKKVTFAQNNVRNVEVPHKKEVNIRGEDVPTVRNLKCL